MTPRPFDFSEAPELPADPAKGPAAPRALDFGDTHAETASPPPGNSPPKPLSFDDLSAAPALSNATVKTAPRALFDSEDHPAVRDALALARADYPVLYGHAEQRLAALFRRILPVRLALVTDWGEGALMEQASLLRPITELVLTFTQMAVPAQLEAALETTRAPSGMFGKLFRRATSPVEFKPVLTSGRTQLQQLMADSDIATRNLEASAHTLSLHAAVLAVVSTLAGDSADVALLDALVQRRTLLQQAVRQAELSILQMGQVRQQAAELIGQVSSFLTVTLPAIEMAQAQGKP